MKKDLILCNAFSLQMLDLTAETAVKIFPMTIEQVKEDLSHGFTSAVGHQDTANVLSNILGIDIPMNRSNVKLDATNYLIVAQVVGGRLPEGATTLPPGTEIKFLGVMIPSGWF